MNFRRARYSKIRKEVVALLDQNQIFAPPVPVDEIARALGARIENATFDDDISGVLVRRGDNVVIGVAKDQAVTRQRFTIAHEIGHLILHKTEEVHVDRGFVVKLRSQVSSAAIDVDEIEANAFAAGLLMPEAFLRKDVRRLDIDLEDDEKVPLLARRYSVSTQAMTIRLLNLFGN